MTSPEIIFFQMFAKTQSSGNQRFVDKDINGFPRFVTKNPKHVLVSPCGPTCFCPLSKLRKVQRKAPDSAESLIPKSIFEAHCKR